VGRGARLATFLLPLLLGCSGGASQIQWDARTQIWRAEASQVKVRAAQSRVFDTSDRLAMLEAVVASFQDIGLQVELLDEKLGIVSGKKWEEIESSADPTYFLYDTERLVVLSRANVFRTWGPFWHRVNLVRFTVTVRPRNERQLIVRASAQSELKPIEAPGPYQAYFRLLEQSLFAQRQLALSRGQGPRAERWPVR
jgi:hypothetical protein